MNEGDLSYLMLLNKLLFPISVIHLFVIEVNSPSVLFVSLYVRKMLISEKTGQRALELVVLSKCI